MEWNDKSEKSLKGKRIAIVATNGFEESELFEPLKALRDADADVEIVAPKAGKIRAWKDNDWGSSIAVDRVLSEADPEDYDGLMLPGGVINADKLRDDEDAVSFVKTIAESGKPIAAICHAAWTLIETGCVSGHEMTSWPSLKTDLQNAGATWVDREVVTDHGWVTSRKPEDLPAFNRKMIEEFQEGKHEFQRPPARAGESLNVGRL